MIDLQRIKVIVMGASMGGIKSYETILSRLSPDFQIPILAVNHITNDFDKSWIKQVNSISPLDVRWGQHFDFVRPGSCLFAPPDHHMHLSGRTRIGLNQEKPFHSCRPAINYLFSTAAEYYKKHALAIMLTGLNHDGIEGLEKIIEYQGQVLIQDPKTASGKAMPEAAVNLVHPENVFTVEEIADLLNIINEEKIAA